MLLQNSASGWRWNKQVLFWILCTLDFIVFILSVLNLFIKLQVDEWHIFCVCMQAALAVHVWLGVWVKMATSLSAGHFALRPLFSLFTDGGYIRLLQRESECACAWGLVGGLRRESRKEAGWRTHTRTKMWQCVSESAHPLNRSALNMNMFVMMHAAMHVLCQDSNTHTETQTGDFKENFHDLFDFYYFNGNS